MILKSKITITSMVAGIIVLAAYAVYAAGESAPAADDMRAWGKLILIFIAVSVGAQIVIQIAAHVAFAVSLGIKNNGDADIVKRTIESETFEDERDKRITLKASHVGYSFTGAGFILALIALAFLDVSAAVFLNMLLVMFFISMMADGIVSVYMYEKGDIGWICGGRDCQ